MTAPSAGLTPSRAALAGLVTVLPGAGLLVLRRWTGALWLLAAAFGYLCLIVPGLAVHFVSVIITGRVAYAESTLRTCPACQEKARQAATVCPHCRGPLVPVTGRPGLAPFILGAVVSLGAGLAILFYVAR